MAEYDVEAWSARVDEVLARGLAPFLASICEDCERVIPRVSETPAIYETLVMCQCRKVVTTKELLDIHGVPMRRWWHRPLQVAD